MLLLIRVAAKGLKKEAARASIKGGAVIALFCTK